MLRIFASNSVEGAKKYYTTNMRGEYYAQGTEMVGKWHGRAATALGLSIVVDQQAFERMCENRHPITGAKLTPGHEGDNRRVLYDCNFHLPKSASIAWAVNKDQGIVDAMEAVSQEVMELMEGYAGTRVRKGGKDEDRRTGNLAWASFVHHTSRPTSAGVPDMHLHTHLTAFNATFDEVEGIWKAAQFGDIKKYAPMFEAIFMSRMAEEMEKLGYTVERDGKYWELVEVDKASRKQYSSRTTEIEIEAERLGINDARQKGNLGKETRKRKSDWSMADCFDGWREGFSDKLLAGFMRGSKAERSAPAYSIEDAIDKAAEHFCENETHFTYEQLIGKACQLASDGKIARDGRSTFELIGERVKERCGEDFISVEMEGQRVMTTRAMLAREKKILAWARDGVGGYKPLIRGVEKVQSLDAKRPELAWAPDQLDAITHVWSNTDRLTLIRGVAGSGKSTLFREAARGIEKHGTGVVGLAPTNSSMKGLKGTTQHVYTFQSFIDPDNTKLHQQHRGKVLWLDEAGMAGSKEILQFLEIAEKNNNRVVFMGDSKQTSSVTAGDVLRQLEERGGLNIKTVKSIQRQRKENYRTMVQDLSDGTARSIDRAFDALETATKTRETQQAVGLADGEAVELGGFSVMAEEDVYTQVATDYLASVDADKTCVAVAPTHKECDRINASVREGLKARGMIAREKARTFKTHRLVNFSETDKQDVARYEEGMRIGFHKRHGTFKAGDYGTVLGVDRQGRLKVKDDDGLIRKVKLDKPKNFDVYGFVDIELAKGDSIVLNRNTKGIGKRFAMKKGNEYTIKGFDAAGNVKLSNGQKIRKDELALTYGYATTIHAAQGRTVDRALYVHLSHFGDRSMMYVGASRARDFVKVYTENLAELRAVVSKSGASITSMEIEEAAIKASKSAAVGADPALLEEIHRLTLPQQIAAVGKAHIINQDNDFGMSKEIGL